MNEYDIILIPVITGVIQLLVGIGLPKKFSPVVSVILGILGGVVYLYPQSVQDGILYGIVFGLSAVGLYSGAKNTTQVIKGDAYK